MSVSCTGGGVPGIHCGSRRSEDEPCQIEDYHRMAQADHLVAFGIQASTIPMGIPIDSMDIHSPSVPPPVQSSTSKDLHQLVEEKTILEGTLARLNAIL